MRKQIYKFNNKETQRDTLGLDQKQFGIIPTKTKINCPNAALKFETPFKMKDKPAEVPLRNYQRQFFPEQVKTNKITIISKTTADFLKGTCNNNKYIITIFRVFLRMILTATWQSQKSQSAVYLYGTTATDTLKSVWVNTAKKFIRDEYVTEFSGPETELGQDLNEKLLQTRFLIVRNCTQITEEQSNFLEWLLTPDPSFIEDKFSKKFGQIRPNCIVLFISNESPESFDLCKKNRTIMEKLISVCLDPALQSNTHKGVDELDPLCPDLFNWVIRSRFENLIELKCAVNLKEFHKSGELTGIADFIADCMWKEEDNFVSLPELKTAYITYLEKFGNEYYSKYCSAMSANEIGMMCNIAFVDIFEENYEIQKFKKRGHRPYGFYGMAVTDGRNKCQKEQHLRFEPKNIEVNLANPFDTERVEVWTNSFNN